MEEEDKEKLQELIEIEELATKIEELSKIVKKIKRRIKDGTEFAVDKKVIAEKEIKQNPLIYVSGAFLGGLIIGYITRRMRT